MTAQISLREFSNLSEADILRWRGLRVKVEVTDDFGEKTFSDTYALMVTWQGLIIHRAYPELPYSIKELVPSNVANGKVSIVYDDNTLAIPLNYCMQELMPHIHDPVETDFIKRMVHIWQGKLNNLLVVMSEESVISATAEDVMDFMEDEGIKEIRRKVHDNEVTIDEGEDLFKDYILETPTLDNNTLAMMARTGGVSINQVYQTTIVRGAVFDLNNAILPNAITRSYADGIINLVDSMGDSRSAGKALNSNGRGLQDAETFHRKIHLFTSVLREINYTHDCNTTNTVPLKVASTEMAMSLLGKYQVLDTGEKVLIDYKQVKKIRVGETVHLRSIAFCATAKRGNPCGCCYGIMKANIPYNTIMRKSANIGMYSGTTICNPLGQKMLSTKHFIRNAVAKTFTPLERDRDIIRSNGDEIFLERDMVRPGTKMVLRAGIVKSLSDLRALDVLDEVSLDKLPYFEEVVFGYEVEDIMIGGKTVQKHPVMTSVSSRQARLSMGMLQYILTNGWEAEDKKFIAVDMSNWNPVDPVFILPFVREDLDAHRSRVENFMTFNKRNNAWKKQVVTPKLFGEVMGEFWTLINQETKGMNMVHIESIIACSLVRNPDARDYSLALGDGEKYFSSFVSCIDNRGMGNVMIFEHQQNTLNNPRTFMIKNRQGSPLETFFKAVT